jgi:uncharacterized protein YecT (DUF1311 family)
MQKKTKFAFVLACLLAYEAGAAETKVNCTGASKAANAEIKAIDLECSNGSALDQYFCFVKKLKHLEDRLEKEFQANVANPSNPWGKVAEEETRARLIATQKAWIEYRNGYCNRSYYTKAPTHPPSESRSITRCKIIKTVERLNEIMAVK